MATTQQRLAAVQWRFNLIKTACRWYMTRKTRIELWSQALTSVGLVAGGIYTAMLGYSFTSSVAFAGAATMNLDLWQVMYAVSQMSKQPPPRFPDDEQEPPRNRQSD